MFLILLTFYFGELVPANLSYFDQFIWEDCLIMLKFLSALEMDYNIVHFWRVDLKRGMMLQVWLTDQKQSSQIKIDTSSVFHFYMNRSNQS